MANEEHLKILKQGVTAWNKWRVQQPAIVLDLSGATLSGASLFRVELWEANLRGANLSDSTLAIANLHKADLSESSLNNAMLRFANLRAANLSGTDLRNADLHSADLKSANLKGADLRGSKLNGADLSFTNLSGCKVHHAEVGATAFVGIDLRGVEGIEDLRHFAPSEVSISTVYRSGGMISDTFLRGCGVPESFAVQVPALVAAMQPIQFYSCFISYSSKDDEVAQRLYADLQSKGVRCWFAPEDLKIGDRFRQRIDEVIRVHDKLLLILSEHSVASSWVEKEVETAMEREDEQERTILFPVRLDDSVIEIKTGWPADVRRTRHIGDFRRWKEHDEYQLAFARLLSDLKARH